MHYLSTRVQDPLLYVVNDMLASLRRFVLYYPSLAEQMVASIRAFTGKVRGPAGALASYLRLLGWDLTEQATLLGPGGLRVNLRGSSNRQIRNQTRIAWDWVCHQNIMHRKGVPLDPFDSTTTLRLLGHRTDRQRRILALSLTSGWQSLGAISQWSATQDPSCPFCAQPDTHTHQLLECPCFEEVRAKHPDALRPSRCGRDRTRGRKGGNGAIQETDVAPVFPFGAFGTSVASWLLTCLVLLFGILDFFLLFQLGLKFVCLKVLLPPQKLFTLLDL